MNTVESFGKLRNASDDNMHHYHKLKFVSFIQLQTQKNSLSISNFALLLGWQKRKQWSIQTWRLGNSQQIHE